MTEFTAKDAVALVDDYNNYCIGINADVYNDLIESIKIEAAKGDRCLYVYKKLPQPVTKKFKENGFGIEFYSDQRDGDITTIRW